MLISCVAFFTTTEAVDPDLSVLLPLLPIAWPFAALLLEAEEPCLELSLDVLPTVFDDPFTSFDVELEAVPLAVVVSSLSLFSAGDGSLVLSVASGKLHVSPFVLGGEEDDWSEAHAEASGGESVLRFLCKKEEKCTHEASLCSRYDSCSCFS